MNWSKTSNRANVGPMETIQEGYTFGKPPYRCQMPAQAVHDCVQAQTHLDVKASARHQQAEVSDGSPLHASWKLARPFPPLWIRCRFGNGLAQLKTA